MAAIIFDFDGTIADSFETLVGIFHDLTSRERHLSPEAIERLRGMPLHSAAGELGIRPWRMPFLVMRGRRRIGKKIGQIKAHPGVSDAIRRLHAEGHQLFIMSSNSEKNISTFLKQHHISKEFVRIYGSVGLLSKARVLRKIRRQNRLGSDTCWYIGDEVRDIEGARLAGIRMIAVTWGFNTAKLLEAHKPTATADKPEDLIRILEEL